MFKIIKQNSKYNLNYRNNRISEFEHNVKDTDRFYFSSTYSLRSSSLFADHILYFDILCNGNAGPSI